MRRLAALLAVASGLGVAAPALAQAPSHDVVRTEPAVAPAPAVAVAAASPAIPVATWAALGLGGVAVALGGTALAVAGVGRRRAEEALAEATRGSAPAGPDPRTAERLDRLEAGLRASAPRTPAAGDRPPARDAFPPRETTAPPPARVQPVVTAASATSTGGAEGMLAWTTALREDFARLARDPPSAAADYITRHRPCGATLSPEGALLLDAFEGAKLWAVRAPGETEVWALTPGEQAAVNWSAHFAPQRTEVAAETFGPAFDLVPGDGAALRLEEPALLRRDASGRLSVRRRGRLSGFRS